MNIFDLHKNIISDYRSYIESFLYIKDTRIEQIVKYELENGRLWPEPLIQFNPTFEKGTYLESLFDAKLVVKQLTKKRQAILIEI